MKNIILSILLGSTVATASAQVDNNATEMQYRRSSIYSLLINHVDQQFASEIKDAFVQIPVPDKFNDHNLSVKVLTLDKKLDNAKSDQENPAITEFLNNNKVASRLVGRWFNRDSYTGVCDMELVKERGLYNASEFDRQLAMHSARGLAMLQDAGEDLIGNTFVLVNDIRYVDKNKAAKTAGSIFKMLGAIGGAAMTANNKSADGRAISDLGNLVGDMAETLKGFTVKINTFLYRLEWTEEQAGEFYQEQYADKPDATKKANFEKGRGKYRLRYVGKVESKGGTTSFLGIKEDEPVVMVRKACQRALDENIVDLQRGYEEFRTKTPLVTVEPITAYIGMKEGVTENSRFEVLETIEMEDGTHKYNKVGEIAPVKNLIWDNRYMASEEGAVGSQLGYTTFRVVKGKDFAKGMLIRDITK